MRFRYLHSQYINMILFAFIVFLLPINSYADNPIILLKDKVQDTFSATFNNKDNNERLDHTSEELDDRENNTAVSDSKAQSTTESVEEVEIAAVKEVSEQPAEDKKHFLWVLKHALLPN